jgi:dipeptidase E
VSERLGAMREARAGETGERAARVRSPEPRRILAMGGGGFTMGERSPALDRFVLELTGRALPRICFIPTASGDQREQLRAFHERFEGWPCEPSALSLFHLGRDRIDPVAHLLAQDAIYVGGGSMRNMLAVWREHGLERAMRSAWERGIVLAGLSAGAMCWFEGGISMSGGRPEPVAGIGLLPGSLSVHLDSEPERLPAFRAAIACGKLAAGWAASDRAALLFAGERLLECVVSCPRGRVLRVQADAPGEVSERPMPLRPLPGAATAEQPHARLEPGAEAVSELRALRSGRRRWD